MFPMKKSQAMPKMKKISSKKKKSIATTRALMDSTVKAQMKAGY